MNKRKSARGKKTYLAADNADLQEIGILGGVLLVDGAGQTAEGLAQNVQVLSGLDHELASITLGDLDVPLKDGVIAEAQLKGSNSHGLGNGAEVEYTLLPEASQVEETFLDMLQSIENHLRVAVQSSLLVLWLEKILKVVDVLGPDLLGPESSLIVKVLADVSDNVGLLQEETHGLLELRALQKSGVAKLSLNKKASQALANQTGHVVAVKIVLFNGLHASILGGSLNAIISHTVAHLVGDILDNGLIGGLHVLKLGNDTLELNQQLPILLLRAVPSEVPAILGEEVLEIPKEGLLGPEGNGGIILNGIQTTEDKVENCDREEKLWMQLFDDCAEAAAGLVQELVANLLCLRIVLLITLMGRVVPDFPMREI